MKNIVVSLSLLLGSSQIQALPIDIIGQENITLHLSSQATKQIVLPTFQMAPEIQDRFRGRLEHYQPYEMLRANIKRHPELPQSINLGMAGTPVLDQGRHGSCATFASTAAIDATLQAGDYVSQLCSLELGTTLALNQEQHWCGWRGSLATVVFNQLLQYGVVSKHHQKLYGCAQIQDYPLDNKQNEGNAMTKSEYNQVSMPIKDLIQIHPMLLDENFAKRSITQEQDIVQAAKTSLAQGKRAVIGMYLYSKFGHAGAVGQHKVVNDSWMVTPEIIVEAFNESKHSGHALLVIAYDDNAEITDNNGHTNKGVFTVRNSWSSVSGDHGNYYISYDYFNLFVHNMNGISLKK